MHISVKCQKLFVTLWTTHASIVKDVHNLLVHQAKPLLKRSLESQMSEKPGFCRASGEGRRRPRFSFTLEQLNQRLYERKQVQVEEVPSENKRKKMKGDRAPPGGSAGGHLIVYWLINWLIDVYFPFLTLQCIENILLYREGERNKPVRAFTSSPPFITLVPEVF